MKAVIITRKHTTLNFGQTVKVLEKNSTNVVVRPDGDNCKYTLDISDIWSSDRAYDYEASNEALSKIKSWLWQSSNEIR